MQLVCEALHGERWIRDIEGVLDMSTLEQYVNLWARLQELQLDGDTDNCFIWK
jgi:hypothetical protein